MGIDTGTAVVGGSTNGTAQGLFIDKQVTAAAGEHLVIFATGTGAGTLSAAAAPSTPAITLTQVGAAPILDAPDDQQCGCWFAENPGANTYTIRVAVSAGSFPYVELAAVPVSGAVASGALVAYGNGTNAGQLQATPTTTTDATTSGAAQTPSAGTTWLVLACSMNVTLVATPAAGTGFTSVITGWPFEVGTPSMRVEKKVQTGGTVQGLFTAGTNQPHITMMVALREAAGASGGTTIDTPTRKLLTGQMPHLRMSPRSQREAQQFLRAQKRAYGFASAA